MGTTMRAAAAGLAWACCVYAVDAGGCNGNGRFRDDVAQCECASCFYGEHCEAFNTSCAIDDLKGNPLLHEEYWAAHPLPTVAADTLSYRTGYQWDLAALHGVPPRQGSLLPALNASITRLHTLVGNVRPRQLQNLVLGCGCTELIDAAIYACAKRHRRPGRKMFVYARAPYYGGYASASTLALAEDELGFTTDATLDPADVIEFVTYPNNPTNEGRSPSYGGRAACTVYDSVYMWPDLWANFTLPQMQPQIQLFSMSKLSGHAGTRFGWGVTEDAGLAALMAQYVKVSSRGPSVDAQLKVLSVLDHYNRDGGKGLSGFFQWIHGKLAARWGVLNGLIGSGSRQTRFTQLAEPHGFYAWVRCEVPAEAGDCAGVFAGAGVEVTPGGKFGAGAEYVRLEMVQNDVLFSLLAERVATLV